MRRIVAIGTVGLVIAVTVVGGVAASAVMSEPDPDPYRGTGQPEDAEVMEEPDVLFSGLVPEIPDSELFLGEDGQWYAVDPELAREASDDPIREPEVFDPNRRPTAEENAELDRAGVDPNATDVVILDAGDCEMEVGDDYMTRLRECAEEAAR